MLSVRYRFHATDHRITFTINHTKPCVVSVRYGLHAAHNHITLTIINHCVFRQLGRSSRHAHPAKPQPPSTTLVNPLYLSRHAQPKYMHHRPHVTPHYCCADTVSAPSSSPSAVILGRCECQCPVACRTFSAHRLTSARVIFSSRHVRHNILAPLIKRRLPPIWFVHSRLS